MVAGSSGRYNKDLRQILRPCHTSGKSALRIPQSIYGESVDIHRQIFRRVSLG